MSTVSNATEENGVEWIGYYPAIISSGRAAYVGLTLVPEGEFEVRITDRKVLEDIKSWLLARVGTAINRHPVEPVFLNQRLENVVIIYATERMDEVKDRMVQVPLNEIVLGVEGSDLRKEIRKLWSLAKGPSEKGQPAEVDGKVDTGGARQPETKK